jgi:hypothetical protein
VYSCSIKALEDPGKGALLASTAAKQKREPKHIGGWMDGWTFDIGFSIARRCCFLCKANNFYDVSAQRENDL